MGVSIVCIYGVVIRDIINKTDKTSGSPWRVILIVRCTRDDRISLEKQLIPSIPLDKVVQFDIVDSMAPTTSFKPLAVQTPNKNDPIEFTVDRVKANSKLDKMQIYPSPDSARPNSHYALANAQILRFARADPCTFYYIVGPLYEVGSSACLMSNILQSLTFTKLYEILMQASTDCAQTHCRR